MTNRVIEQYTTGQLVLDGTLGHLSAKESMLLQLLWRKLLDTFATSASELADAPPAPPDAAQRSSKRSARTHAAPPEKPATSWFGFGAAAKREDASYRQTVAQQAPASSCPPPFAAQARARTIRDAFWAATLCDHPDVLVLRFLRARKWNVDDALAMLLACLRWRLDEEVDWVVWTGESALNLALMQRGMGAIHKTDRLGQPVLYIPVRLNDPSAQPQEQMVDYTVYLMEVARILLHPPAEKVCLVFDTTDMAMANMDWSFFKTFLHYLEHYYPECLGLVLIYNASWVFNSLWKIVCPLLDPVVASKVHFAQSQADMLKFIAPENLPVAYGGTNTFAYQYVMPRANENAPMADEGARGAAVHARRDACERFEAITRRWAGVDSAASNPLALADERAAAADELVAASKVMDKHVRARTLYHRIGVIDSDLNIHW
ncbi:phosphatidylinositol transfer protein csr1 [Coemansia sp. RSA 2711]|nr:phosphatidylinositol transfer protein csr1 [Coemansia sp. RSA 2711]